MADQIVVIDKVEDDSYDGKDFKKVTDKAGQVWKIKQGRGGALKEKWGLLEEGKAIKLMMGDFQGKPFVLDFEVVKDAFVAEAAEKVQTKQVDTKDKGICLSYAKDLVIAGKVEFKNMVLEMSIKGNLIRGAKKEVESVDRGMDLFAGIALGIFTDEFLTFKKEVGEVFKIDGGTQSGKLLKMAGEGIGEEPRVIVGTIHSIKGGECDHVWIDVGTSWECKKAMVKDKVVFWDECRVGYVGVTRAIKSVGLLHGEG
ncbi:hypothetical protein LCGC14_2580130, partial [marine sediment metagenome]